MKDNTALWFFVGAKHGPAILIMTGIAIALFAIFGTLVLIWASLPK